MPQHPPGQPVRPPRCWVAVVTAACLGFAGQLPAHAKPTPALSPTPARAQAAASPSPTATATPEVAEIVHINQATSVLPAAPAYPIPAGTAASRPAATPEDSHTAYTPEPTSDLLSRLAWGLVFVLSVSSAAGWFLLFRSAPHFYKTSHLRRLLFPGAPRASDVLRSPSGSREGRTIPMYSDETSELRALLLNIKNMVSTLQGGEKSSGSPAIHKAPARGRVVGEESVPIPLASGRASGESDLQRVLYEIQQLKNLFIQQQPFDPAARTEAAYIAGHEQTTCSTEPTYRTSPARPKEEQLVDDYNHAAGSGRPGEDEFKARVNVFRCGVKNRLERMQNAEIPPVFGREQQGDYLAVELSGDRLAVFPYFGLPINQTRYTAGAMGVVFECPNYRSGLVHKTEAVIRAAIFELTAAEEWRLAARGDVQLDQGKPPA